MLKMNCLTLYCFWCKECLAAKEDVFDVLKYMDEGTWTGSFLNLVIDCLGDYMVGIVYFVNI